MVSAAQNAVPESVPPSHEPSSSAFPPNDVFSFRLPALGGGELDFSRWRGRPLLIVNTASRCGFTPQYEALEKLWRAQNKDSDDGLVVIGVPSGDFGDQELEKNSDVAAFCQTRYGVTFPLAAKAHVRGPQADPLYRWLGKQVGWAGLPRWNFHKYLVDRSGKRVRWYLPLTPPDSPRFQKAVRRVLRPLPLGV